jgi:hypothetical protein
LTIFHSLVLLESCAKNAEEATAQVAVRRNQHNQVRGPAVFTEAVDLIQSGPLRRDPARIFDNQVEHASREKTMKIGLIIILTK